jgi:CheY-like chemotaxis protein
MKVLVVDDDAINRLILRKLFEREKDEVTTAENGCEAMKILSLNTDFHIVITDIMMPEMDGIELLAEIRLNEKMNQIPIIGFTAGDINYFREKSAIAFDRLLHKPMDFYHLYDIAKGFADQAKI